MAVVYLRQFRTKEFCRVTGVPEVEVFNDPERGACVSLAGLRPFVERLMRERADQKHLLRDLLVTLEKLVGNERASLNELQRLWYGEK